MLNISDLHVAYGSSEVLHGLSFDVAPGEIVAVMGRNGMGKTTLMKSLMGIVPQSSGAVMVDGADMSGAKSHQRVKGGLGYVPQGRMIFSTMTVRENIETGRIVTGKSDIPEEIYALFPILWEFDKRRGGNLSGGQQQQLAIARALASDPKILLLDEPTEGIQPSIIKDIAKVLKEIRKLRNICIVVCEQLLSFVLDVADRVLVMENGRVVHVQTRAEIDEAAIARYLSV
jgi:urea transport system ATP-binding protein